MILLILLIHIQQVMSGLILHPPPKIFQAEKEPVVRANHQITIILPVGDPD